jgi:shikimate kinase
MNITLIGMAGVGKSSIGKKLAKKLDFDFLDPDELIKQKTLLSLQHIIDQKGEKYFLELEQQVITGLESIENTVICPGGSVVYSEKAMGFLQQHSTIVFLKAEIGQIKQHLTDLNRRGIVGLEGQSLDDLYQKRIPLYEKYAQITVCLSEDENIDVQAEKIFDAVFKRS